MGSQLSDRAHTHLGYLWNSKKDARAQFSSVQLLSRVRLFATRWIITWQAPLSMEFSRREDWSGLAFPPSGDLPDPEIGPASLASPALAGGFFCTTGKAPNFIIVDKIYKVLQRKFRSSDLLNCKLLWWSWWGIKNNFSMYFLSLLSFINQF